MGPLPFPLSSPPPIFTPSLPDLTESSVFSLSSVTQISLTTIKVTFTEYPLAANFNGPNDALNILNYSLIGPGPVTISNITPTSGEPQSVNLIVTTPLSVGTWILNASTNIQTVSGISLQSPKSLSFEIDLFLNQNQPSGGGINNTAEDIIHKYFNPALVGSNWDALIAGIAVGEQYNYNTAELAFDQLFKISAGGIYLDRLAIDEGIVRPLNLGMSDDLFRQFSIKTTNHKLTEESFLEVLEIFYGSDSVRAHNSTDLLEPYFLNDGDNLRVLIDGQQFVNIVFKNVDFVNINSASAVEVVGAINRAFQLNNIKAYAQLKKSPFNNSGFVVIYTDSLGLGGSVTITGGSAQNFLQFSEFLDIQQLNLPTWNITFNPTTNTLRFTTTTVNSVDLTQLLIGDYVNIFGNEFQLQNRGTYTVTNVSFFYVGLVLNQYFEVINPNGINQLGLTQTNINDLLYYRPVRETIYNNISRAVIVSQPSYITDIILPVTSQAVNRQELTAAYLQQNVPEEIVSLERIDGIVTVNLVDHELEAGNQIIVDNVAPNFTPPLTIFGSSAGTSGISDSSKVTIWSETSTDPGILRFENGISIKLLDGRIFLAGGSQFNGIITTYNSNSNLFVANSIVTNPDSTTVVNYTYFVGPVAPVASTGKLNNCKASLGNVNDNFLNGQVIITGGDDGTLIYNNSSYFDPAVNTWVAGPNLNNNRSSHTQNTLDDGSILVMGGFSVSLTTATNTVEKLSGPGYLWTNMSNMNLARANHQSVVLQNGNVLVIGGEDSSVLTNTCEIYDPIGNSWSYTGFMTFSRIQHKAILLSNGKVLVVGGIGLNPTRGGDIVHPLTDAEIYDPDTGRWYAAGQTLYTHDSGIAEFLPFHNQVILVGGTTSLNTEIYDVEKGSWSVSGASLISYREISQSAILNDQIMILFGGTDNSGVTSTEDFIYISNSDRISGGGLNGIFEVNTVIDSNNFTYLTDNRDYSFSNNVDATVMTVKAQPGQFRGPFIYDTQGGVALSGTSTFITQDLDKGSNYTILNVIDATQFPDTPGYLCFDFGQENQIAPVRYFGRISNMQLALDDGFIFPKTVKAGGQVAITSGGGTGSTTLTTTPSPVAIPIGTSLLISGGTGSAEVGITTDHVYVGDTIINLSSGLIGNNRDTVIIALTNVHLLLYKGTYKPTNATSVGSFYVTDSPIGRISAINTIRATKAAGVEVDIKTIYPSGRGLGGEGSPTSGVGKLSDVVIVYSEDYQSD